MVTQQSVIAGPKMPEERAKREICRIPSVSTWMTPQPRRGSRPYCTMRLATRKALNQSDVESYESLGVGLCSSGIDSILRERKQAGAELGD